MTDSSWFTSSDENLWAEDPFDVDPFASEDSLQEPQPVLTGTARYIALLSKSKNSDDGETDLDSMSSDADNSDKDAQQSGLTIQFLDKSRLEAFENKSKSSPKERKLLAESIVAQINAAGGEQRCLGLLPTKWAEKLEECRALFPNFSVLIDYLSNHFALSAVGDGRVYWPPVLLTGAPGVGKTAIARWMAAQVGLPFRAFDMATEQSASFLSGSDVFWSNAQPGHLFNLLTSERWANPLIVLDELDKAEGEGRFNPMASLYTLMEQESARVFKDLCVPDLVIDASHVNWIATANDKSQIPAPILSRMTVLHIEPPTPEQIRGIAQNVYEKLCKEASWGGFFDAQLDDNVLDVLMDYSPRELKRVLLDALGAAAKFRRPKIVVEDVSAEPSSCRKWSIGFVYNM